MKGPDKVSYYGIDVIKFLFALLVVTAHFDPFGDVSGTASYIARHYVARMTVPFFIWLRLFSCFASWISGGRTGGLPEAT